MPGHDAEAIIRKIAARPGLDPEFMSFLGERIARLEAKGSSVLTLRLSADPNVRNILAHTRSQYDPHGENWPFGTVLDKLLGQCDEEMRRLAP